jgi:transposase-like protein
VIKSNSEPELPQTQTACPFCRSANVTTASEHPNRSTYWRCQACGEMWNVDRLRKPSNRYNDSPRWR